MPAPPPEQSSGPTHRGDTDLTMEGPGSAPIAVVPWPLMWRERINDRLGGNERQHWVVLVTVLYGLFAVGFTITVLAVSLDVMAADLDASRATITWVITGPMLAMAVVGPTWGKLADIHGARRIYLIAMSMATVFAALTALAWDGGSVVAFRVLAAATGAAAGPASMALINSSFPRERRIQAMGYWALVAAGGPVVGVVAGGPIVEQFGWQWIFVAQAPLTALGVVLAFAVLPETTRQPDVRFDIAGSILIALTAGSALFALNRAPEVGWGWSHPLVVGGLVMAPVFAATFVFVERRVAEPLLPLRYLRRGNFAFPIANQFFTNFAYMGGFILTPALLQDVYGLSVSESGFVSIVRPLTFAIAGPLAGWLALRIGERTAGVSGSVFIAASMVMFALAASGADTTTTLLPVLAALALSGVGMGAASPAMAASVANAVDDRDLGIAGASQQMVSTLGVVTGTQVLFTVQQAQANGGLAGSYGAAYLVGAVGAAMAVVAATFVRRTPRGSPGGDGAPAGDPARTDDSSGAPARHGAPPKERPVDVSR